MDEVEEEMMMSKMGFKALKSTLWMSFLVLGSVFCVQANAAETENAFRLSEFYAGNSILRLQGENAVGELAIPLSPLVKAASSTLHIKATSSIALQEPRSVLNVRFNNATIGQIALDPKRPEFSADLDIPAVLWRKEFNSLTFVVSQHSHICQAKDAPELWTEIDLYESTLTLNTSVDTNKLSLQKLSGFFHPGVGSQRDVTIYAMDSDDDIALIKSSAIPAIAQGLALREQYRALTFDYQPILPDSMLNTVDTSSMSNSQREQYQHSSWYTANPNIDALHVLVGTRDTLAEFVSVDVLDSIKGSFLMIEETPEVTNGETVIIPSQVRLIVSGLTGAEVAKAATTLALMDDALNPDQYVNIMGQSTPILLSPQQNVELHSGQTYSFKQLGHNTTTFTGSGSFVSNLDVRLPADFYVAENASVKLKLDFGYGAGHGPGSIMNILVNGEVIHALALNDINGNSYRNYMLSIPARYFNGGSNRLEFYVNQTTVPFPGECTNINGGYLHFGLSDSSEIELPEVAHLARQPSLGLMADTGYPFAQFNTLEPTNIYVTQPEMYGSALTVIGKIAQSARNVMPNLNVEFGLPEQLTTNAMVLSRPVDLNNALFEQVALSISKTKEWPYRLQNQLYNRVAANTLGSKQRDLIATDYTKEESSLGALSVLVAMKNPSATPIGTLFIVAADDVSVMKVRIDELVQGSLWSQLAGDFFAWQNDKKPELVTQISTPYEVGQADSMLEVRAWLSHNPWYWMIAALCAVLMMSLLSYILLKRRHKKMKGEW
jgi:hypothetical protein